MFAGTVGGILTTEQAHIARVHIYITQLVTATERTALERLQRLGERYFLEG